MPIVYANIHQSIYCSRLTHLPSCLGFFYNLKKREKKQLAYEVYNLEKNFMQFWLEFLFSPFGQQLENKLILYLRITQGLFPDDNTVGPGITNALLIKSMFFIITMLNISN